MSSRIVAAALGGVPPEVTGSPTIQDVARLAKVSTATVSRALTRPERVAEPTRRAVLAAIERTGYRVNRTARNLRRRRAGAIVVLVPNLGNPFFSVVLNTVDPVMRDLGFTCAHGGFGFGSDHGIGRL